VGKLFVRALGASALTVYLLLTILIGWIARRRNAGAGDFLNASRSLPLWVVVAAFLSANCGALEIVGLSAVAAQYGVQAFHFYWIGAIPGMVFVGGVMIPVYMRSGVQSLPEYLERRFDTRLRMINSGLILLAGTALSGIGLYAMEQVLHVMFGWPFAASGLLLAVVVLIYVYLGGLRATIYNEIFQLLIILTGLLPLFFRTSRTFHNLPSVPGSHWHLWIGLPVVSHTATLDQLGVTLGLGFVLSFSYWCTDFVQIQRALTARTVAEGRLVPLLAGFGKLGFSLLVVVPGLEAARFLGQRMPASFDQTLPALMAASYGPALLGLGITALLASLMSGLAANVSAFSSVWTEEIYRRIIRRGASEEHYIRVGRIAIAVAIALSIANSYLAFYFRDLMEYVQMIFSLFGAPFFAVFLIGIFTRRATARGALVGLLSGILSAIAHHVLIAIGWMVYGSSMTATFYVAIYAFFISLGAGLLFSNKADRATDAHLERLVYRPRQNDDPTRASAVWKVLACLLLAACAVLNYIWR
jgi:SSS family solute:Na+ symporter